VLQLDYNVFGSNVLMVCSVRQCL